jgi:uroporphyrin-III C-methyltransferase
MKPSLVSIVGAGPGDPDLISVKGLQRLRQADVVLHDRLVHPQLLEEARADANVIDVGKRRGREDERQVEIHRLMISHALEGDTVCRLKGGDGFIFGRGGEEIEALLKAQIPFEVIPGISSVIAGPAAAGIPLTHRDYTHGFLVIAGSRSVDFSAAEWESARVLLKGGGTVVILMGLERIEEIAKHLVSEGCKPQTPAAVVVKATWPDEEIWFGTIATMSKRSPKSPAMIVLGDVVRFARTLKNHE